MEGVNKILLLGRLGSNAELAYTQSKVPVLKFNLATTERFKDRPDETTWHRVVVWGKLAEALGNFLTKGSLVFVEGRLVKRKWKDKSGFERESVEVISQKLQILESKGNGNTIPPDPGPLMDPDEIAS